MMRINSAIAQRRGGVVLGDVHSGDRTDIGPMPALAGTAVELYSAAVTVLAGVLLAAPYRWSI
jgi:hypothetical protein